MTDSSSCVPDAQWNLGRQLLWRFEEGANERRSFSALEIKPIKNKIKTKPLVSCEFVLAITCSYGRLKLLEL